MSLKALFSAVFELEGQQTKPQFQGFFFFLIVVFFSEKSHLHNVTPGKSDAFRQSFPRSSLGTVQVLNATCRCGCQVYILIHVPPLEASHVSHDICMMRRQNAFTKAQYAKLAVFAVFQI